ncbi:caspase family protein [Streptomyces luteireticuli]|uniref:Peptidase C14 caspase domain-containing protein n=1 Tax=Streptomyces luteireticuli TaxID=173858 RepID=A0ABP3IPH0_9ACTN
MHYLIAAGTQCYHQHPGLAELPLAHDDVNRIVQFLTAPEMGYTRVLEAVSKDPTAADFEDALADWCLGTNLTADDVVTVYYAGHGDEPTPGARYRLACADTREGRSRSWLSLENLAEALAASPVRHVLFIIDACHAAVGAAGIAAVTQGIVAIRPRSDSYGSGTWVLASARHRDEAKDGAFVARFVAACEQGDGPSQRYLSPATVADRVNHAFAAYGHRQRAACSSTDQAKRPPFFPNNGFDPIAEVSADGTPPGEASDLTSHFEPRGRGVEQVYDPGSYFTGRGRALTVLHGHLSSTDGHGALVVTAEPGSGKSAVLGRLVLDGYSDVSINARHQVVDDLVGRLAAAADIRAASPTALLKAVANRDRPFRIVVDSVDEAGPAGDRAEARRIAWELLRPLAAVPCVRVVIGARRELLPYIGDQVQVVDLDSVEYSDDTSTAEYVERILTDVSSPYRALPGSARAIAEEVARLAGHCFLVARMAASALLRCGPIDTQVPGWAESLPSDVGGAFEAYLRRLPDERREAATWLLITLAFSEGHGLPRKIWLPVARRLSGLSLSEAEVDRLLEEEGSYLSIVEMAGAKHFRLYHQALTDHLRQRTLRRWDLRDIAERFVDTLLDLTPDRDWSRAHPYVRGHLATHAAAAGTIERFVADPSFILAAEPAGLLTAVRHVRRNPALAMAVERCADILGPTAPQGVDRAARLAFAAESNGATELARRAEELSTSVQRVRVESRLVTPHRIVGRHEDASYSTTSFTGGWLIEDAVLPDGSRVVLAVFTRSSYRHVPGERDPHVHVWALDDPSRSTVLPHPAAVVGLALLPASQGQVLAITLDRTGGFRVWDLADQTLVQHVQGTGYQAILDTGELHDGAPVVVCRDEQQVVVHNPKVGPVFEVAFTPPQDPTAWRQVTARLVHLKGGEPALVVCDATQGTVTRWALEGPRIPSVLLEGLDNPVLLDKALQGKDTATVVVLETNYQSSSPQRLFLLDCGSGRVSVSEREHHDAWLRGGFVSLGRSESLYVAAGRWTDIHIRSTTTGLSETIRPKILTNYFVPLPVPLRGRVHAVVGDHTEGICILDCTTGTPVSAPLRGHDGAVRAVHLLDSDDPESLDILTLGNDGTARLWHWRSEGHSRPQDPDVEEKEGNSVFAMAHTQAIYSWAARPDVAVASSWGGFRLVNAAALDLAGAKHERLIARKLLDTRNAEESWAQDPDGTVHILVKSEQIVDTERESLTKASFSWHRLTTPETVVSADLRRLQMVPWGVDCHLVPASTLHPCTRVVGYCPENGRLYAVQSPDAETATMRSWWSVDPADDMVCSTAFTSRTGHAVLMVAVRKAAVRGDFTPSDRIVGSDGEDADAPARGFLWDATARRALRRAPVELPARLIALVPHHAVEGTRYVAMACSNGKAAVFDLDTDQTHVIHPPSPDRGRRRTFPIRELSCGDGYFLRWADTSGGAPVLLYMDAAESDESRPLPVTVWHPAVPEAPAQTLAVRARRLLWTGTTPNGEALVAVSDEHGVALCHLPSGERVWSTPLPALVTSLAVLPDSPTLDLAVGTQQGVVLLRPRLPPAWRQRLGVH